jgi:hypothetical protein
VRPNLAQINPIYFLFISFVGRVRIRGHLLFLCLENLVDIRDPLIFTYLLAYFSLHFVRDTVWTIYSGPRHRSFRFFTIFKDGVDISLLTWFFLGPLSLIAVTLISVSPRVRQRVICRVPTILSLAGCIQRDF